MGILSLQVSLYQERLLSHSHPSVGSVWQLLYEYLTAKDVYLAFLPLAHILEFAVENSFVFAGLPIGYGRVKTLTDASVRECKGDIAELQPVSTILYSSQSLTSRRVYWSGFLRSGSLSERVFLQRWTQPEVLRSQSSTSLLKPSKRQILIRYRSLLVSPMP
jgi:hypothetical protein